MPERIAPAAAPVPAPVSAPVVPEQAPHAQTDDSGDAAKNARLRAKADSLRNAPRTVPVSDVTIIMGMATKQGRQEVIHDIGPDYRILDCVYNVKEKVRAVTEEGMYLGVEPTGEYEMTIKVKYLKL